MNYEHKTILKFFIVIFLISFSIINWKELLIASNWFFSQPEKKPVSTSSDSSFELKSESPSISKEISKENRLEIPKIKVSAPIITSDKKETRKKYLEQLLKKGVLFYPKVFFGEKGKAIILGHSASPNWPNINYDHIFDNLNQLEKEDEIIVHYNQEKYIYKVFDKRIFLPKNEEQGLLIKEEKDESYLVLLTCWPPGKNYKRLTILTKLIK